MISLAEQQKVATTLRDALADENLCGAEIVGVMIHAIVDIVREEVGPDQAEVERVLDGVGRGLQLVGRRRPAVASP
jgi:hypothetical protein